MGKVILICKNIGFLLKKIAGMDWLYIPLMFARTLFASALPLIAAIFPAHIIRNVQARDSKAALTWIVFFFLIVSILQAALHKLDACIGTKNQYIDGKMKETLDLRAMEIKLEELSRRDVINRIIFARESLEKVELSQIVADVFRIASAVSILSGTVYILSEIGAKVLVVFFAILTANLIVEKQRMKQRRNFDEQHVEDRRNLDYSLGLFSDSSMAKELRVFDMKTFVSDNFRKRYDSYEQAYHKTRIPRLMLYFVNFFCDAIRDFSIYVAVTYDLIRGRIDIGGFYLYTAAASQMYSALRSVTNALLSLGDKAGYIECIRCFLNEQYEAQEGRGLSGEGGRISFDHVSFRYHGQDKDALEDISFSIDKGEKIGIVGANGAGKTTLVRLLLGMYAPTSGRVLYQGTDVSELAQEEYLKEYSAVFQKAMVLPETVRENVTLSDGNKPVLYEEAMLGEKVSSLPFGEETKLVRNLDASATDLSGGEEQRLMILRAIYREAQIYVLDEPASALSPRAEYELVERLLERLSSKTAVIISHRMGIIQRCSQIMVLKDGRMEEQGTHEELMAKKGTYAKMYLMQARRYAEEGQSRRAGT